MIVNLKGVENQEARKYIRQEGHYTLKCVDIKKVRMSENGNPIYRFSFVDKNGDYFIDDITITENTKWKIKQIAEAFGFTYDNVNIMHFIDMYLVAWIVARKVKNRAEQIVDVFECKQYIKSAKLTNNIPAEYSRVEPKIIHENQQQIEAEIDDNEIPF